MASDLRRVGDRLHGRRATRRTPTQRAPARVTFGDCAVHSLPLIDQVLMLMRMMTVILAPRFKAKANLVNALVVAGSCMTLS